MRNTQRTDRSRLVCRGSPLLGAAIGGAFLLMGCAVNPVTGERELALISENQEIELGREAARDVRAALSFVEDRDLQAYVSGVGLELARDSERPDLPWEFHVVDDPTPNAFALPGGFIFVTRGLMNLMRSEAELAAVLGHEIGHVTARHSVSQLTRAQLAQIGIGIGVVVSPELLEQFGGLADLGLNLLFLKYSRDDERQADELSFRYMLAARYDVGEMDDVFESLEASSRLAGASPVPGWLASHPSEPERIEAARQRAEALTEPTADLEVNRSGYLAEIDGLAYGPNPRNGYFDAGMFYHPELAFQFRVPEDWQKQNLASAVVARSPDRAAGLQLTLSANDARQAAVAFMRQSGVREISSSETTLDGRPAIISRFAGRTEAGDVLGVVAHIGRPSGSYRLVTYASAQAARAYEDTLLGIVQSFARLSDREILAVEPRRIEIVSLPEDMSFTEFARRYPSEAPVEELAVINGVRDTQAPLGANTEVKRVV